MAVTLAYTTSWTRSSWSGLLFLALVSRALGLDITYCSSDNTGLYFPAVYNQYQSNGACHETCRGQYSMAVLLGANCWCSNYAPATTVSTGNCNSPCPGFGSDWCGNPSEGYYAYFLIDGASPVGTLGTSSSTTPVSSSILATSSLSISSASTLPSTSSSQSSSSASSHSSLSTTSSSPPSSTTQPPTEVYTSVTTVTGQVRTVIVTPTPPTDSTLGSSSSSGGGGGVSPGKVVGIVVGVALGIGLLIGLGVWYWLRRRHQRNMTAIAAEGTLTGTNNSVPSRQVSQMSSAGLLTRGPRINTTGLPPGNGPRSPQNSQLNRQSLGTDQRLNPYAIYAQEESRHSNVSLQDNHDYSRQLRVANPDP